MKYILRDCPFCGKTIMIEDGGNIPKDIVMTQGRSKRTVTLAHLKCLPTRKTLENTKR